jgi:undecaprenyl-diphosphatase
MSRLAIALDSLDHQLHVHLHHLPLSPALRALLRTCSTLGDGWTWILGALALLGASRPFAALGLAVAMAAAVNLTVVLVKTFVRRQRPGVYERNAFLTVAVGGPPACDVYSFPSGHAANAAALAVVLSHEFPALTAAAFAVALLIGTSRVLLGQHYLSDMVAGALMGLVAGAALVGVRVFAA